MSEKHRSLPLWMVKSGDQNSKDAVKKKAHGITKKPPKSTIEYWMNEKELVETAVNLLTGSSKVCARDAVNLSEVVEIPETDAETSDSDISNIEVAEQETVQYENCTNEGTSTKLDSHFKPHINPETTEKPEALELVREIFFT